jgi:hypothetical protein
MPAAIAASFKISKRFAFAILRLTVTSASTFEYAKGDIAEEESKRDTPEHKGHNAGLTSLLKQFRII